MFISCLLSLPHTFILSHPCFRPAAGVPDRRVGMCVSLGASNTGATFQSGKRKAGLHCCSTSGSERVVKSLPSSSSSDDVLTRCKWRDSWRRTAKGASAADGTRERSHRPVSLANLCQAFTNSISSEGERGLAAQLRIFDNMYFASPNSIGAYRTPRIRSKHQVQIG